MNEHEIKKRVEIIRCISIYEEELYNDMQFYKERLDCQHYTDNQFIGCIERINPYDFAEWTIKNPEEIYPGIRDRVIEEDTLMYAKKIFLFVDRYKTYFNDSIYMNKKEFDINSIYNGLLNKRDEYLNEIIKNIHLHKEIEVEYLDLIHMNLQFTTNKELIFKYLDKSNEHKALIYNNYDKCFYIYEERDSEPIIRCSYDSEGMPKLIDYLENDVDSITELDINARFSFGECKIIHFLYEILDEYEIDERNRNTNFFMGIFDKAFGSVQDISFIDYKTAEDIIESREPYGLFIYKYSEDEWVGIDNTCKEAFCESFPSKETAIYWLNGASDLAENFFECDNELRR